MKRDGSEVSTLCKGGFRRVTRKFHPPPPPESASYLRRPSASLTSSLKPAVLVGIGASRIIRWFADSGSSTALQRRGMAQQGNSDTPLLMSTHYVTAIPFFWKPADMQWRPGLWAPLHLANGEAVRSVRAFYQSRICDLSTTTSSSRRERKSLEQTCQKFREKGIFREEIASGALLPSLVLRPPPTNP